MTIAVRSPWQVMQSSIIALTVRNIQRRFITHANSQRSITFLWVFLEPMMHIAIWSAVRLMYGSQNNEGIAGPIFIMLGAVTLLLTRKTTTSAVTSIKASKGLYTFRQVRPIDPILASVLSEVLIIASVSLLLLIAFLWLNIPWHLTKPLTLFVNSLSLCVFLIGFCLSVAVLGFFLTFLKNFSMVFNRIVYFTSGVFYSASMIPPKVRHYFLYNPIFQFIEISRECFAEHTLHVTYGSPIYLAKCAIVSLFIGLMLYVTLRYRIMTEIEQR